MLGRVKNIFLEKSHNKFSFFLFILGITSKLFILCTLKAHSPQSPTFIDNLILIINLPTHAFINCQFANIYIGVVFST